MCNKKDIKQVILFIGPDPETLPNVLPKDLRKFMAETVFARGVASHALKQPSTRAEAQLVAEQQFVGRLGPIIGLDNARATGKVYFTRRALKD